MSALRRLPTMLDVPEAQRRPMSRIESETFIRVTMAETAGRTEVLAGGQMLAKAQKDAAPLQLLILTSRVDAAAPGERFSYFTAIVLAGLCSNPAQAVMWAHYLVRRTRELGAVITTSHLAHDFPMGFPTEEGSSVIWDAQKRRPEDPPSGNGNCLDDEWPWLKPTATAEASL